MSARLYSNIKKNGYEEVKCNDCNKIAYIKKDKYEALKNKKNQKWCCIKSETDSYYHLCSPCYKKRKEIESEVNCKYCNKIEYVDKEKFNNLGENYKSNKGRRLGSDFICSVCYKKNIRPNKVSDEAINGTIISCIFCKASDRMYYLHHSIAYPKYWELTNIGWHKFGPKWICSKCYDKNIRVVPRDDKDYPLED
jgi:hypothetical protein